VRANGPAPVAVEVEELLLLVDELPVVEETVEALGRHWE
jgi:hypothetical protein